MILIPALAIPMPLLAQAYGNLFLPALLLVFGLGAMLYSAGRRGPCSADPVSTSCESDGQMIIANTPGKNRLPDAAPALP